MARGRAQAPGQLTPEQHRLLSAAKSKLFGGPRGHRYAEGWSVLLIPTTGPPEYIELRRRDALHRITQRYVVYARPLRSCTIRYVNALLAEVAQHGTRANSREGAGEVGPHNGRTVARGDQAHRRADRAREAQDA